MLRGQIEYNLCQMNDNLLEAERPTETGSLKRNLPIGNHCEQNITLALILFVNRHEEPHSRIRRSVVSRICKGHHIKEKRARF